MTEGRMIPQLVLAGSLLAAGLVPLGGAPALIVGRLRDDGRNRADMDRMDRGYYESLLATGPRLEARVDTPPPPPFKDGPLAVGVPDYRECVLRPNLAYPYQYGTWTNNSLGLHDREYAPQKPPGTFRVVMLGDSIGVGWGLDDGRGFEPTLEGSLDGRSRARGGPAVEILNLSVPGYAPGQRVEHLERLGWSLEPDLILYEATAADLAWDERRLRGLLPQGIGADVPMLRPVLDRAGLKAGADPQEVAARLKPYRRDLVRSVYDHLGAEARGHGVPVVWVLIPRVGRRIEPAERDDLVRMARDAGFAAVIDLSDAFDGVPAESLAVAPSDYHPNEAGHRRIAERLEAALFTHPAAVRLRWPWEVRVDDPSGVTR